MYYLYFKELKFFFYSLVGMISVITFVFVSGLVMFVFEDTNVFDYGYASMEIYFNSITILYILFLPAVCMNMLAEEKKLGTYELLKVLPIKTHQVLIAKFLSAITISILMYLPTYIYVFSLQQLILDGVSLDYGSIVTSYLGLSFLIIMLSSLSLFASAVTNNALIAFLLGLLFNVLFFYGFDNLAKLFSYTNSLDYIIEYLGIKSHYENFSIGYLDFSDVFYFLSFSSIFMIMAYFKMKTDS